MTRPLGAWQATSPRLILASTSSTRLTLLRAAGIEVEAQASGVDETPIKIEARRNGCDAGEAALLLAEVKAAPVAARSPGAIILAADQILSSGETWFDKPRSRDEARAQLLSQRGAEQRLHTAAVLMSDAGTVIWRYLAEPRIRMRRFSDAFLELYLDHEGDVLLSCVGACRIEGPGQLLIERIEGEHAAILGLPMLALTAELRRRGVLLA